MTDDAVTKSHNHWLELAAELGMRPTIVVSVCYLLSRGWLAEVVAIALDISPKIVAFVADRVRRCDRCEGERKA